MKMAAWERQPGESAKAFAAFTVYRNLPATERSLTRLASDKVCHRSQGGRWSGQWRWVERAAAWDAELDRIAREKQIEAVEKMNERHAQVLRGVFVTGAKALQEIDPSTLTPDQVLRYIGEAVKLERLIHGVPESVTEVHQTGDQTVIEVIVGQEPSREPER